MRFLSGMLGLGDNVYQRAVLRELGEIALVTSWPQLYADLPQIRCVKPFTRLRTQSKNARRDDLDWDEAPPRQAPTKFGYDAHGTILESMLRRAGIQRDALTFDLPEVEPGSGRYVVVRPATIRQEWRAAARNPDPLGLDRAARAAAEAGYEVISIADLDPPAEFAVEPLPFAHRRHHHGELQVEEVMSLVAGAAGVIGGVGFLVPMAVAYRVPMLLLFGGWGAMHGPQRIFDARMDLSRMIQAFPQPFCMCNNREHACPRSIPTLEARIGLFLNLAQTRVAERTAVAGL